MNTATSCGYTELESALHAAEAECGAAESHGVLCGIICATGNSSPGAWLEHLLGEGNTLSVPAQTARDMLAALYSLTLSRLNDADLGLELLLPDDAVPLPVRNQALGEWCQGYLYGLAMGGVRENAGVSGHVAEIMQDLYEISHVRSEYDADAETEEAAYFEISEYVRMCVLLCHEELQPLQAPARLQ